MAAAVAVLRSGGNAVDAAVSAGFAAAVAEPGLTSLGGGGFLVTRSADGDTSMLDFFVDTPGSGLPEADLAPHFTPVTVVFTDAEQVFHAGYGSVAVPGILPGYLTAHRQLGHLPLEDIVAPASALARAGAHLSGTQAHVLELLKTIVSLTPDAARLFVTNGDTPPAGAAFRNPDYADFLDTLGRLDPAGWKDLPQAAAITTAMRENGGLVTDDDLATYAVHHRPLHVGGYRGSTLSTNPPPSFGGSIVCAALSELNAGPSQPTARDLVEALHQATTAQKTARPQSVTGTTHVSVIDSDGMVASMTTSNGSCSGVLVPGTGIQLNNMMGEADLHPDGFHAAEPGTRVASMMAPSIVDLPDGSVVAIGSGGSERIRSALLQTVTGLVGGHSLAQAVTAPRVHFDGRTIQLEPGVPDSVASELEQVAPVNRWSRPSLYFGGVNAVQRHPDGRLEAVGDARRDGASAVIDL